MFPLVALGVNDCPFGKTDDSCDFPGECGRYVDVDNNKTCDHSQSELENVSSNTITNEVENETDEHDLITGKELKTKTVKEVAKIYQINSLIYAKELGESYKIIIDPSDSFQLLHDNYGLEPNLAKEIALSIKNEKENTDSSAKVKNKSKKYHLVSLTVLTILLYLVTYFLVKRKNISLLTHKRIWNTLLLITFLISGISGILLVIKINFGFIISMPFNILVWHVEVGIVMFVISVIHVIEHRHFYKSMVRKKHNK